MCINQQFSRNLADGNRLIFDLSVECLTRQNALSYFSTVLHTNALRNALHRALFYEIGTYSEREVSLTDGKK